MTKEQFEQAKELEKRISHITEALGFIAEHRRIDGIETNIFITTQADDDFIALNGDEVQFIYDALESRKNVLEHEFMRL